MPTLQLEALAPQEAIAWLKRRGLRVSWNWKDLWDIADHQSFMVSSVTSLELIDDLRDEIARALESGMPFEDFQGKAEKILQYHGWFGKRISQDPITGKEREVEISNAARLENIFTTNINAAISEGRNETIAQVAAERTARGEGETYLRFNAVPHSGRTCATCESFDGFTRPISDPIWSSMSPALHNRCRCFTSSLTEDDLSDFGYSVSRQREINLKTYTNDRTGYTVRALEGVQPGFGRKNWDQELGQFFDAYLKSASPDNRKAILARRPKRFTQAVKAEPQAVAINIIRHINGGWYVYSGDGKKRLSRKLATKAEALKRLRQVEYYKNAKL